MSLNPNESRRQFLTAGFRQSDAADGSVDDRTPTSSSAPDDRQLSHVAQFLKQAMACQFELLLNMHQYPSAGSVALRAFQLIDAFEAQMSIYRVDSELSRINQNAGREPVAVDPLLFEMLQLARDIHDETEGAFDMTSGHLSDLWGFSRRQGKVPTPAEIANALTKTSSAAIELDTPSQRIHFSIDGLKLNPGGIGKGFTVDRVVEFMDAEGLEHFVLHAGQSSVAARGNCLDMESESKGWKIGLSHPLLPQTRMATIRLIDQSLGTSGTQRQGFFHHGKRFGHIIDPRTGWPTDHCLSSTVICKSAARADALATAFFVMRLEQIQSYCDQHPDVAALLVLPGGRDSLIQLEMFNTEGIEVQTQTKKRPN